MMNGNDAPNVKDLRETVFEAARTFLTDVSATELAELVAGEIETMDCLELTDDDVTWERVDDVRTPVAFDAAQYDRCGHWSVSVRAA